MSVSTACSISHAQGHATKHNYIITIMHEAPIRTMCRIYVDHGLMMIDHSANMPLGCLREPDTCYHGNMIYTYAVSCCKSLGAEHLLAIGTLHLNVL